MACFAVTVAEAVVTTIAAKAVKSKEGEPTERAEAGAAKIPFSKKLGWLNKMLWGGSVLLAFEHIWHGEITPVFPFLTAVQNGDVSGMLAEMGSVGVAMSVLITAVWGCMVAVSTAIENSSDGMKVSEEGARK